MRKPKTSVHSQPKPVVKKGFNDNDVRYMCCRGRYHLRKGAMIVGGVELIAVFITIIYCLIAYFLDGFYKTSPMKTDPIHGRKSLLILALVMSIIAGLIWSLAIGLMAWGIKKSKPSLLIPHMMIQALAIVSLAGLTALFIWWAIDVNDPDTIQSTSSTKIKFGSWDPEFRTDRNNVIIATVIFSLLAIASGVGFFMEIFFVFIVRRCYKYLRAKINYQQQQLRKHSQAAQIR